MNTKQKVIGLGSLLGLVLIVITVSVFLKAPEAKEQTDQESVTQAVSTDEPADIVLDFYDQWLEAAKSTSTDPFQLGLAAYPLLGRALSTRLKESRANDEKGLDPVLCQSVLPERINARSIYTQEDQAQILVKAKDKTVTEQAIVTLKKQNAGWYIDDITCSPGELEALREFSFDMEGYLLKSVPLPLDPHYWHLVFEENGEQGHFVKLFLNAESTCLSLEGVETTCVPDQFIEAKKVHIYGQMTEPGVEVKRLEFLE